MPGIWQSARLLLALLAALALPASTLARQTPPPPTAPLPGVGDALFEKIKGVLVGSIDPDAIEMARFSIAHPYEAATLYSRAAAQDYPLFGLIGAVKTARKAGFTKAQCMKPITLVDSVFAKASSTIDSGKAEADGVAAAAQDIVAEAAKAQTDQARQQLIEQIPYFGDIPTICLFAFETDFAVETNLQNKLNQASQDMRTAYYAFKSGDVVTGVGMLATLGVSGPVACKLADAAVGDGIVGRTPLLGALAKDACAGFVGNVLDGVKGLVKGGVGFFEAGVQTAQNGFCKVYSWIGSGCSAAEPPPTAGSTAAAWCAPHGGIKALGSVTNQPDDYNLICNDGSQCRARPGTVTQCSTGAEIAAYETQRIAMNEAEFQIKLPQWQAEFTSRWEQRCPDEACRAGIRVVRLNATNLATAAHQARPDHVFQMATYFPFEAADRQAVTVIDDVSYRILPDRWAKSYQARWSERCEDNQCRTAIRFIAANTLGAVRQRGMMTPRPPYGTSAGNYASAEDQGAAQVALSSKRMADFNKNLTAQFSVVWQRVMIDHWGRQCADALCLQEVTNLAGQLRTAANLLQQAHPDQSSLWVQTQLGPEFGAKFKAAVDASEARAAAKLPKVPAPVARKVGPLQSFLQPPRIARPRALRPLPVAEPAAPRPVRTVPAPVTRPAAPAAQPAPAPRPIRIAPAPVTRPAAPATPPTPTPRPIRIVPTPRPSPSPSASPTGGRPPPRP